VKVVVFYKDATPRVLNNPSDLDAWSQMSNAAVDPDLRSVKGVPTEFWKLNPRKVVVEMNDGEKAKRLAKSGGARVQQVSYYIEKAIKDVRRRYALYASLYILLSFVVGFALSDYLGPKTLSKYLASGWAGLL